MRRDSRTISFDNLYQAEGMKQKTTNATYGGFISALRESRRILSKSQSFLNLTTTIPLRSTNISGLATPKSPPVASVTLSPTPTAATPTATATGTIIGDDDQVDGFFTKRNSSSSSKPLQSLQSRRNPSDDNCITLIIPHEPDGEIIDQIILNSHKNDKTLRDLLQEVLDKYGLQSSDYDCYSANKQISLATPMQNLTPGKITLNAIGKDSSNNKSLTTRKNEKRNSLSGHADEDENKLENTAESSTSTSSSSSSSVLRNNGTLTNKLDENVEEIKNKKSIPPPSSSSSSGGGGGGHVSGSASVRIIARPPGVGGRKTMERPASMMSLNHIVHPSRSTVVAGGGGNNGRNLDPVHEQQQQQSQQSHASRQSSSINAPSVNSTNPMSPTNFLRNFENSDLGSLPWSKFNRSSQALNNIFPFRNSNKEKVEQLNEKLRGMKPISDLLDPLEDSWESIVLGAADMPLNEMKHQAAVWELLYTEYNFLRQLKSIESVFKSTFITIQKDFFPEIRSSTAIFSNISDVIQNHYQLWNDVLLPCVQSSRCYKHPLQPRIMKMGFLQIAELLRSYPIYCKEMNSCRRYIQEQEKQSLCFAAFLQWGASLQSSSRLSLCDQLAKPFQRLTKYKLLLQRIRDYSLNGEEKSDLDQMIRAVDDFVCYVNEEIHRQELLEKLDKINKLIDGYEAIELPGEEYQGALSTFTTFSLTSSMMTSLRRLGGGSSGAGPGGVGVGNNNAPIIAHPIRHIVRQGTLRLKEGMNKAVEVYCYLFTDLLLITRPNKKSEKLKISKPPIRLDRLFARKVQAVSMAWVVVNDFRCATALYGVSSNDPRQIADWLDAIKKTKKNYEHMLHECAALCGSPSIPFADDQDYLPSIQEGGSGISIVIGSAGDGNSIGDNYSTAAAAGYLGQWKSTDLPDVKIIGSSPMKDTHDGDEDEVDYDGNYNDKSFERNNIKFPYLTSHTNNIQSQSDYSLDKSCHLHKESTSLITNTLAAGGGGSSVGEGGITTTVGNNTVPTLRRSPVDIRCFHELSPPPQRPRSVTDLCALLPPPLRGDESIVNTGGGGGGGGGAIVSDLELAAYGSASSTINSPRRSRSRTPRSQDRRFQTDPTPAITGLGNDETDSAHRHDDSTTLWQSNQTLPRTEKESSSDGRSGHHHHHHHNNNNHCSNGNGVGIVSGSNGNGRRTRPSFDSSSGVSSIGRSEMEISDYKMSNIEIVIVPSEPHRRPQDLSLASESSTSSLPIQHSSSSPTVSASHVSPHSVNSTTSTQSSAQSSSTTSSNNSSRNSSVARMSPTAIHSTLFLSDKVAATTSSATQTSPRKQQYQPVKKNHHRNIDHFSIPLDYSRRLSHSLSDLTDLL